MSDPEGYTAAVPEQKPLPGLPPVAPPSGRFILQLFLVPGLIVGALVCMVLVGKWMFGSPTSPESFLRGLDDPNPEVRWRKAADLAQVLPRNEELARDTRFALALTERLRQAIADNRIAETVRHEQLKESKEDPAPASKTLQSERAHIWYLIACLGNFQVPVGAPLLQQIALEKYGSDAEAAFRRRLIAVSALTVLGNNLKKFDRLPGEPRAKVLDDLKAESDGESERARWARETVVFLEARQSGKPAATLRVADTLAELARDPAPFLRKHAAVALNHWDGSRAEETLFRLVADDGRGDDPIQYDEAIEEYRKAHPAEVRRQNQKDIAYNAALTLARRGSPRAEELFDVYEELLDLDRQREIWTTEDEAQQSSLNARIIDMALNALNALDQLRTHQPAFPFIPSALDALVEHDNKALRTTALELRKKLQ